MSPSLHFMVETCSLPVFEWISQKLKTAGHQVTGVFPTGVHDHELSLRYGKNLDSNSVVAIDQLLRPLALVWEGVTDSDFDLEIRILPDFRQSQTSVQLFACRQSLIDKAHERLSQHGFGVAATGVREDIDQNMAADGTGVPTVTGFVAWAAGMTAQTAFVDGREYSPFTTLYIAELRNDAH